MTISLDDLYGPLGSSAPAKKQGNLGAAIDLDSMYGPLAPPEPTRTVLGTAGDLVNAASHGVTAAAQGLVGFADLAGGLAGGRGEIGKFLDTNEFSVEHGLRFKDINKKLDNMFQSEAQKAADKRVDAVDGFWNTAVAMGQNPSTILKSVVESLPAMYTGAKAGGAVAFIANKLPAGLEKFAPSIAAKIRTIGDAGAAAIGEGIISGGQTAEQVRSESEDGSITGKQQLISAGSGILTAGLSGLSNKIGAHFGIDDPETAMVRGALRAKNEAAPLAEKGVFRRVLETGAKEGFIEELPQSMQEQMAQNWAQDKPITEGVGKAAAQGAITGFAQGGGHSALSGIVGREKSESTPDSPSRQFAQTAFANVSGDDTFLQQQQRDRASIALALSQLDDEELKTATTHLAGGNEQLQQLLQQSARDPETVKNYNNVVGRGSVEYVEVSDQIRRDSGITVDNTQETPTAPAAVNSTVVAENQSQTTAVDPTVGTNSAGFKTEPIAQLQAQLLALADGRKPGVVMGVQEANQLRDSGALDGFAEGTATDPSGTEAVFVGKDNEAVNAAVTRASEVGLKQAAGEFLQYANPTATTDVPANASVVQQVDDHTGHVLDEQIVTPDQAANIKRIPGTSVRTVPVSQALYERTQSVQNEQSTAVTPDVTAVPPVSQPQEQSSVPQADQTQQSQPQAQAPAAEVAPLRQQTTETSTATPRMQSWVDSFNASKGIAQDSDQQVDASSIREFAPQKGSALSKIAAAVKEAFGVSVVFVETPHGGLMRKNGNKYNSFNGFVDLRNKSLVLNVDTATPLNTLGHELAHLLKVSFPDIYGKLELSVLSRMSYKQAKEFKDGLQKALDQEGDKASIEQEFRDEVVAEALGEMTQDQAFWSDVFDQIGEDEAKAKTLYDTVMQVLAKLAKAFTKNKFIPGVKDMQKVRRAATDAFIEWSARIENPNNLGPESLKAFKQTQSEDKAQEAPKAESVHMFGRDFPKTLEDNDPLLRNTVEINTPERIALRNQIIDSHFEGRTPVHYGKPSITLLGGGGGVGKSTVLKFMQRVLKTVQMDESLVKINADDIKVILPEYQQIKEKKDWRAATTVHAESSLISKAIQYRALGMTSDQVAAEFKPYIPTTSHGKYDILLDATMSDAKKGKALVEDANGRGYHVKLIAVVANPESAIERAYERGKKSGRYVPDEVVAEAHAGFLNAIKLYSNVVDDFSLWDNDVPLNSPAIQKGVNDEQYRQTIAGYAAAAQRLGATSSGQTGNAVTGGKESDVAGSAGGQRQAGEGTGQEQSQHGLAGGLTQFSRDSIQRAIDGERTGPLLVSEKPPAKLAKFLDSLPVTISDKIIRKVASGKKGDRPTFTAKQIESLTQLLENPAAVFQSASREDSIVVLTNLVVNGEPVIAAIERGSNRTYTVDITPTKSRQIEFNSNAINSSYPKDLTGIRNWIASGRLLQWDKNLTGKPGFPQTVHAWLAQGARFMGKPVPALKTESAGTLDKVDAPIAPTAQQNQPKTESVQKPAGGVNEKNALTLKKTSFGRIFDVPLSTTKLMGMPDEEARSILGLKTTGKGATLNKVRKIGEAINAAIHREGGLKNMMGKRGVMTENAIDSLSNAMVDEVMHQLVGEEDTGSGLGWYSNNYPKAVKRLAKRFPELETSEDARTIFTALVAVTSNGEKVEKNIKNAIKLYAEYRDGKPLVAMGNRRATALESNLKRIEDLVAEFGISGLRTELMKETTVSEMNAALRAMGEKPDGSYKADTVVPRAAIYFGPKLGAFYANLMGAEGYLTMDLWWSRTINRMRGMLVPKATPSSIQTFREIIGDPSLTDDQVIAASEDVGKRYKEYNYTTELEYLTGSKESKYPGGSEAWLAKAREATGPAYEQMLLNHRAEKAANNIYKPEFLELQETPFNASDRESMYAAARMTQSKLEDKGIKLSLADIQAALWYYEKRFYQKLSGRKADDIGYEEAIVAQADEAGGRAEPSVRFHRGNDAGIESVRGDQKADTAIKRTGSSEATKGSGQSVTFEVAPSPDNKELHDRWQALPDAKKTDISLTIGKKYVEKALSALGMRGSIEVRIGSYIDATTPSFTASLEDGGDPMMLAGFMGYVLSQKEMMVTSDKPFNGGEERGAVTLTLPDGLTISEIDAIYQDLRTLKNKGGESVVGGQTTSGNQMAILNFSEYSGEQLTTEEMALRIDAHLGGRYTVHYDNVFSAMPGESDYNYDSNQQNGETIARRPSLQGDASSLRIQATADLAAALGATNFSRTADAAPAARLAEPAGRPSIGSSPSQRGSTVSQAIHYGKQAGLSNLSGSSFGTGIKGAELERLNKPGVDPRIKKRVYFYLPVEGGIPASESGLGGNVYSADLKNMYDPDGSVKGEGNAFESAVLDAGYKGYLNRMQGTAVVLNSDVPVRYLGTSDQFNKVQRMIQRIAPTVQTRTEGGETVRKMDNTISLKAKEAAQIAAPSFKQQYGEARVATEEKNAANEALSSSGSDFQFSRIGDSYFSDRAMEKASSKDDSYVTHLSPEEFLSLASQGGSITKAQGVDLLLKQGSLFSDIPSIYLTYGPNGEARVTRHDGRHRVRALADLGVNSVPVLVEGRYSGPVAQKISLIDAGITTAKSQEGNSQIDISKAETRFSRNATKLMTAQEMEVFAKTGKLPYKLGDAIRRLNFADAFMLAKDKNERQQLLNDIGDSVIHSIMDGLIPVQRWIEKLPMSNLFRQRLQGDMRRADTVRSAMEKEVKQKFAEEMYKAVEDVSKQTKFTTDQIKKFVGSWMTAKYAPKANKHLIAKDRKALIEAQNEVNAAAKELAAAQQARVAARMPGVAGSVVSAAALRLANAQKREADAIPKLADARRELAERLADVNSAAGTQNFVRGVAGGLNDAMAASIVSEIEGKIDPQLLAAVAKPAYAMLAWKKNLDLASGKVTQTMVNSWPNHADYVPLTGDPRYDKDSSDVFQYGNQLNQDSDKEMNGRKDSIADDGLDAAFTAVMKSINFSAFQDFKRSLNTAYESAQRSGQDIGLTREPITGIMRNSDDVIIYRDATSNGMKAYALKFKDQAIIEAIKKSNHETLNRFLNIVAVPTRWYGRLVTQFAPAFAPINFIRDLWERSEFLRVRDLYDQNGNKVDVDKAARASIAYSLDPKAWKASAQVNFETSGTSPLRATLERFLKVGGSSTWGDYLAKSASNLEADIRGNTGTVTRGVNNAVEKVHAWNNMFEMVAPLSIFRALLDQNMSEKDAAAATLDLMNFRKRGTAMPGIRALWVFAQPAATSGYNLAQYLSTKKGQKRFAAQLLLGTVLYALLRGAWGDDDDEELGNKLDNLPNFTVERSIPVKMGDMMVKIPVGFGAPQLAWAMAGILNRWYSGRYDATTALLEGAKAWTKSVSPINPSDLEISKRPVDFMATTIVPTVFRPILNIFADQTGLGSPLTPQFKNDKKMNWEQAMRTTPQLYTDMAEALHEMTGWDVFPDHIKALSDGYMIGPMREIMSYFVDNPAREMRGEKTRIPLVASLVDNIRDRQLLNNVYYRERDAIAGVAKEYESRMARNDLADWVTPEKTQQLMAYKQFKSQELMFGKMRNNLSKSKLDPESRSVQLQAIEEQADNARRRVLVTFLQNKEKP